MLQAIDYGDYCGYSDVQGSQLFNLKTFQIKIRNEQNRNKICIKN